MRRAESARLFKTRPHACGYYPDRIAENLVIDPEAPNLGLLYGTALNQGYRRSGGHLYRPACSSCQACVPTRIEVDRFTPNRTQRRVLKRNQDLTIRTVPAGTDPEHFALYQRYLSERHAGGGMDQGNQDAFREFLLAPFARSLFLEIRHESRLLACAVTDHTEQGLSAVYTFFDPEFSGRSLGVLAILKQIALCRRLGLPYLYLGFWLSAHPKMDYKRQFQPQEHLGPDGIWRLAPPQSGVPY
ncbi:arginyltransferase [Ahniella affigens]|uniref:Aspartate/glutamate leucyltransferase n=1 Tax=Ahniella affigens TaxID=2021234 RepID=A0A2P1PVY8_9GAMM|nr:arginyltransferase [Ahniella affigens]AVP99000.1 arginyltransferase [Ahniella affigens]